MIGSDSVRLGAPVPATAPYYHVVAVTMSPEDFPSLASGLKDEVENTAVAIIGLGPILP